ncbi:hypothetical protein [Mycoplasmopsis citelli]|uniref:hypothetical protein n=1 Tax=Mycoplasmopsis citelli TaxID=171281 RepID=UPI00101C2242|nr:hypothetical protein [Mycoplasmopsis citelli]
MFVLFEASFKDSKALTLACLIFNSSLSKNACSAFLPFEEAIALSAKAIESWRLLNAWAFLVILSSCFWISSKRFSFCGSFKFGFCAAILACFLSSLTCSSSF